ncbi:NAD(P)-binding domain-containing protein [Flavobacteriaceae bacterium R38]|nr:NAD(P)-binding domain-containing protein [Flavobacteriaceae bacterium R38]
MKLGFIGVGKIASAVIEGLCTSTIENINIYLSPRNKDNVAKLTNRFSNTQKMQSNQEVLDASDVIFIALRPTDAEQELATLQFNEHHTVISFIPYLTYTDLKKLVQPAHQISRAIPLPTVVNHNCPIPVFNATALVLQIFNHIGQPLSVKNENELHSIWTLTGLITPFYELMGSLSDWTNSNGVAKEVANQYVSDLFQSLAYTAQKAETIDFDELANHAATPNGMNEQAGKEIREKGTHEIYKTAADNLLANFMKNL